MNKGITRVEMRVLPGKSRTRTLEVDVNDSKSVRDFLASLVGSDISVTLVSWQLSREELLINWSDAVHAGETLLGFEEWRNQ